MVNLNERTSKSFFCERETTAYLLLRIAQSPPPGSSLLGKPNELVGTLRSHVGINLSRTAHLNGKFQEAVDSAALG